MKYVLQIFSSVTDNIMGEFKRSPSKFSWDNELLESRSNCRSPGSQDSGFSDTETSSNLRSSKTKVTRLTPQKHKFSSLRDSLENVRLTKSETKLKQSNLVETNKCLTDPICKKPIALPRFKKNLFAVQDVVDEAPADESNSSQEEAADGCSSSCGCGQQDNEESSHTDDHYDSCTYSSDSEKELEFGLEDAFEDLKFTSTPKIQEQEMQSRFKKRPVNLLVQLHHQR